MIRSLALGLVAFASVAQAQSPAYLNQDALTRELRNLVSSSSSATMTSLGKTIGGRDIWVVQIANAGGMPAKDRPGVLMVANLEGDQLVGSSNALETVRYLLANATTPAAKQVLDKQVVYIFPRLNPDGAELSFAAVKTGQMKNLRPYDDDNDGRIDEDGPEDLNGDGVISVMRVKDPRGAYMIDPADPRAMKKADVAKGEVGGYSLYWEGIDSDGDGFLNEDGPGGVDLNRNFQHDYPYFKPDAGPHMVSEKETRALMDFMITHRNIGAIMTYGHSDNLVVAPDATGRLAAPTTIGLNAFAETANEKMFDVGMLPTPPLPFGAQTRMRGAQPGADNNPASGRRPDTTVNRGDVEYFKAVSEAYKTITGIKTVPASRRPHGAFFQYGYYQFGVPSFSTPGWAPTAAVAAKPEAGAAATTPATPALTGDAAILKSLDAAGLDAFVPWTAYTHAELGALEIGGFKPYASTNPRAQDLVELGRKQGEFLVKLASMLPSLHIAKTEVVAHGGGIFTVNVEVENTGFFPASTLHGVSTRSVNATLVQIDVPAENIVTGAEKSVRIRNLSGSNSRERITWVIRGRPNASVRISVLAQKGGTDSATVILK